MHESGSLSIVGLLGVTCVVAVACSDPEVPEAPLPDAGAPTTTTATVAATTTTAPPPPVDGPCDGTMQLALQTAIKGRETAELGPGVKAESAFVCQTVAAGGKITVPVTLQPGKCYTFLAHSFPNVTDIDVFLRPNLGPSPPPLLAMFANTVIAQDSEQGPIASIGGGKNCFKNPFPIPGAGVVEVVAKQGGGPIAIQVYSK
jgi:hypothetical protein